MSTPPRLLTLEEIQDALGKAVASVEDLDAKLSLVNDDTPEDEVHRLQEEFDKGNAEVERFRKAIERKEQMQAAVRRMPEADTKPAAGAGIRVNEPAVYRTNGPNSFYRDALALSKGGHDPGAVSRMARHYAEMRQKFPDREEFAMTTASGSGIGLVPPEDLQDQLLAFSRAGRPLADAIGSMPLPLNTGGSFTVPRITTGATTAVQASEGGAVQDNSDVTDVVTMTPSTIAGKVDMSRQLFDFSTPAAEAVITRDLGAAYGLQVDSELINGPGSGCP